MWAELVSLWRTVVAIVYLAVPRLLGIRPPSHVVDRHDARLGVVIHGLCGTTSDTWHYYRALLQHTKWSVFCPEIPNRCRGRVDSLVSAVVAPIIGHCVLHINSKQEDKQIVIYGQSRGGIVAAKCALVLREKCPDWTISVVTICSPFYGSTRLSRSQPAWILRLLTWYYGCESVDELRPRNPHLYHLRREMLAARGDYLKFEHHVGVADLLVPFSADQCLPDTHFLPLDGHYSAMLDVLFRRVCGGNHVPSLWPSAGHVLLTDILKS